MKCVRSSSTFVLISRAPRNCQDDFRTAKLNYFLTFHFSCGWLFWYSLEAINFAVYLDFPISAVLLLDPPRTTEIEGGGGSQCKCQLSATPFLLYNIRIVVSRSRISIIRGNSVISLDLIWVLLPLTEEASTAAAKLEVNGECRSRCT